MEIEEMARVLGAHRSTRRKMYDLLCDDCNTVIGRPHVNEDWALAVHQAVMLVIALANHPATVRGNGRFTPLPADARMDGYYIEFERTGVDPIDAILSAVAIAGKGSHSTDGWTECDESTAAYYSWYEYLPDAENALDLIQKTAERSAAEITAALSIVGRQV